MTRESALRGFAKENDVAVSNLSLEGVSEVTHNGKPNLTMKPKVFLGDKNTSGGTHLEAEYSILMAKSILKKKHNTLKEEKDLNPLDNQSHSSSFSHSVASGIDNQGRPIQKLRPSSITTFSSCFQRSTTTKSPKFGKGPNIRTSSTTWAKDEGWTEMGTHPISNFSDFRNKTSSESESGCNGTGGKITGTSALGMQGSGIPTTISSPEPSAHSKGITTPSSSREAVFDVIEKALVQGSLDGKYVGTCLVSISVPLPTSYSAPPAFSTPPFLVIEDAKGIFLYKRSLDRAVLSQDPQRPLYVYVEGEDDRFEGRSGKGSEHLPTHQGLEEVEGMCDYSASARWIEGDWSLMFHVQEAVAHFFASVATSLASFYAVFPLPARIPNPFPVVKMLYHSPTPIRNSRGSANSSHINDICCSNNTIGSANGLGCAYLSGTCSRGSATSAGEGRGILLQRGTEVHFSYSLWKLENVCSTKAAVRLGELVGEAPREAAKKLIVGASGQPWIDQVFEGAMMDMIPGDIKIISFLPPTSFPPTSLCQSSFFPASSPCTFWGRNPLIAWLSCVSITTTTASLLLPRSGVASVDNVRPDSSESVSLSTREGPSSSVSAECTSLVSCRYLASKGAEERSVLYPYDSSVTSSSMDTQLHLNGEKALFQPMRQQRSSPDVTQALASLQSQISALQLTFKQLCNDNAISIPFSSLLESSPGLSSTVACSENGEGKLAHECLSTSASGADSTLNGGRSRDDSDHGEEKKEVEGRDSGMATATMPVFGYSKKVEEAEDPPKVLGKSSSSSTESYPLSYSSESVLPGVHTAPDWELQATQLCRDVYKDIKHQLTFDVYSRRRQGREVLSKGQRQYVLHIVGKCIKQKEGEFRRGKGTYLMPERSTEFSNGKQIPLRVPSAGGASLDSSLLSSLQSYPNSQYSTPYSSPMPERQLLSSSSCPPSIQRGEDYHQLLGGRTPQHRDFSTPTFRGPQGIGRPPPSPLILRGGAGLLFDERNSNRLTEGDCMKKGERSEGRMLYRYHSGKLEGSGRSSTGTPFSVFRSLGRTLSSGNSQFFDGSRGGSSLLLRNSSVNSQREDEDMPGATRCCSLMSSVVGTPVPRKAVLLGSQDFCVSSTPLALSEDRE